MCYHALIVLSWLSQALAVHNSEAGATFDARFRSTTDPLQFRPFVQAIHLALQRPHLFPHTGDEIPDEAESE